MTGGGNVHRRTIALEGISQNTVHGFAKKYFTSQGFSLKSDTNPGQLVFKRGSYIGLTLRTITMYLVVLIISDDSGVDIRCEFYTPGTTLFREDVCMLNAEIDSFKQSLIQQEIA